MNDFNYLDKNSIYFDSACQSLRPEPVIETLNNYYKTHNSCGERVKYQWGIITDEKVFATRQKVLNYLKLKKKHYFVSFTLNTTYGINLILNSLNFDSISKIIISETEHNSVFIPTLQIAKKLNIPHIILKRSEDGSLDLSGIDYQNALLVTNAVSNIDGRRLENIKEITKKIKKAKGYIVIDGAQAIAHDKDLLEDTEVDAICFSAHKAYSASLGVMVIRYDFAKKLSPIFLGGGMVDGIKDGDFLPSYQNKDHIHTIFEAGLQAWGEIIAFKTALDWIENIDKETFQNNIEKIFNFLKNHQSIELINQSSSPTLSFYFKNLDSHLIGSALAKENIMVRVGHFCAHYYLNEIKNYPPLIRISLGLHNKPSDIDKIISFLDKI